MPIGPASSHSAQMPWLDMKKLFAPWTQHWSVNMWRRLSGNNSLGSFSQGVFEKFGRDPKGEFRIFTFSSIHCQGGLRSLGFNAARAAASIGFMSRPKSLQMIASSGLLPDAETLIDVLRVVAPRLPAADRRLVLVIAHRAELRVGLSRPRDANAKSVLPARSQTGSSTRSRRSSGSR